MTQKEKRELAALEQRVKDFYKGGSSYQGECEDDWLMTLEEAERVLYALSAEWPSIERDGSGEGLPWFIYQNHCLSKFEHPKSAAIWLYKHGARA